MTKSLLKKNTHKKISNKLLIQFSWSIADIFGKDITNDTVHNLYMALIDVYRSMHLHYSANLLWDKLKNTPRYSLD